MKTSWESILVIGCVLLLTAAAGCGKDTIEQSDPERDFVGQWTWENRFENEGGIRIIERWTLIFYDPEANSFLGGMSGAGFITSSDTYAYRWIYLYTVDGVEDESKNYEEMGKFIADGTDVEFISTDGETTVYQYLIPTSGLIDMVLTDGDGVEWIFAKKEAAW
ncbi:hypothetical protein ACFLT7_03435 [candidate division KSB1 bacterium]